MESEDGAETPIRTGDNIMMRAMILLVFGPLLASGVQTHAQPLCEPVHVAGLRGSAYDLEVIGSKVYVANGYGGLVVYDVSDPSNPHPIGSSDSIGEATSVAMNGDLACIATSNRTVHFFDTSDPALPAIGAAIENAGRNIAVWHDALFAAGSALQIFEISDPHAPVELASFPTASYATRIRIEDDIACVEVGDTVLLLDVRDPRAPLELATIQVQPFSGIGGFEIEGERLLVAHGRANSANPTGLSVYDLPVVGPPGVIGHAPTDMEPTALAASGDIAYVATDDRSLLVIDTLSMNILTTRLLPAVAIRMRVVDGTLYIADGSGGLRLMDVSEPANPLALGHHSTPHSASSVAVSDGIVAVADGVGGLRLVDVSDPVHPVSIGLSPTGEYSLAVAIADDRAYVTGSTVLSVHDVSDPTSPVTLGTTDTSGKGSVLAVADEVAYVGDYGYLWAFDVSDPSAPLELSFTYVLSTGRLPTTDLLVRDGVVYFASGHWGLYLVDVTTPTSPQVIGSLEDEAAYGVAFIDDDFLAATSSSGLGIIDISDPTNPRRVGRVAMPYDRPRYFSPRWAPRLAVDDGLAYVGTADSGSLVVVAVSNPVHPIVLREVELPGWPLDVAVADGVAYVAGEYGGGLQIFDVSGCATCPVDYDNDGLAGSGDIAHFLATWNLERDLGCDPLFETCNSNFNVDRLLNSADVLAFMSAWVQGCTQ